MMMSKHNEIMIPYQSDEVCPLCQNNRYLNPNMVLLLSECFHKM
jgi:CDK-activating kinase assembly factor MAT1